MSQTITPSASAPVEALRLDRQLCFALYGAANRVTRLYRPLDLDSSTLTPLLKRLEAGGLIARARDPKDERRVIVALTDRGLALRDQAATIPEKILCQMDLPLEDLGSLRDRLKTLAV